MAEFGDGKKKPSGAQNRKRKLEKEKKIQKLISPIDSFFRPGKFSQLLVGVPLWYLPTSQSTTL